MFHGGHICCRFVAFDHKEGDVYLVALAEDSGSRDADEWLRWRQADVQHALQSTEVSGSRPPGLHSAWTADASSLGRAANGHAGRSGVADYHEASPSCNGNGQASHQNMWQRT